MLRIYRSIAQVELSLSFFSGGLVRRRAVLRLGELVDLFSSETSGA